MGENAEKPEGPSPGPSPEPSPETYIDLAQRAGELFQTNRFGWMATGGNGPHGPQGGWILSTDAEGSPDHVVAFSSRLAEHVTGQTRMRLWVAHPENPETAAGICAFLIFGKYEALFTGSGQPIFFEASEETRRAYALHYQTIPLFKAISTALEKGDEQVKEMLENLSNSFPDDDDDEEEWKKA